MLAATNPVSRRWPPTCPPGIASTCNGHRTSKKLGRDIGPDVLKWVDKQLKSKAHPEQAYRVCLGLLNLSRQYPAQRLDAACRIANQASLNRLKQIKSILKSNRDRLPEQLELQAELPQDHENIRGPRDYH